MDYLKVEPIEGEVRDGYYVQPLLKRIWAVQLDMLKDIDKICRRHRIRYFGCFGTLLGAVRHHGFIPWDDDLDLAMVRDDYERFRYYAKTELPKGWVIKEDYPTWICLLNSNEASLDQKFLDKYHGCPYITGIDIFSVDHVPQHKEDEELWKNMFQAVLPLCVNWDYPEDHEEWKGKSKWTYLEEVEEITGYHFDRQSPLREQLYFLADRIAAMYWDDGSDSMTRLTRLINDPEYHIPISCFKKIIRVPFENTTIPILEDYDLICRMDYGDNYMTPIKVEEHDYLKKQIGALREGFENAGRTLPESFDMKFDDII